VIPGWVETILDEFSILFSFQTKVCLNNLLSNFSSLILKNEELMVWKSFSGHTFCSVFLHNLSGKSVDCNSITFIKVSWDLSGVSIFPFSTVVVVSWEPIKMSIEACKFSAGFFNFSLSDVRLSLNVLVTVRAGGIRIRFHLSEF
jgi:hypothetical protein